MAASFEFVAAVALAAAAACLMPRVTTTVSAIAPALALAFVSSSLFAVVLTLPAALAGFCAFEAELESTSELPFPPVFPDNPVADPDVHCVACGAEGGWVVAAADGVADADGLGGADVPASSNAANGCEVVSWLDACIRDDDVSETAAGKSGAILNILDTRRPPEAPLTWTRFDLDPRLCLQPAGHRGLMLRVN